MQLLSDLLLARYQVDFRSGDSGETQPIAKAHHLERFHHDIPNADIEVESCEYPCVHSGLDRVTRATVGGGVEVHHRCADRVHKPILEINAGCRLKQVARATFTWTSSA